MGFSFFELGSKSVPGSCILYYSALRPYNEKFGKLERDNRKRERERERGKNQETRKKDKEVWYINHEKFWWRKFRRKTSTIKLSVKIFNISVKYFGQIFNSKEWISLMKTKRDWVNLEYKISMSGNGWVCPNKNLNFHKMICYLI